MVTEQATSSKQMTFQEINDALMNDDIVLDETATAPVHMPHTQEDLDRRHSSTPSPSRSHSPQQPHISTPTRAAYFNTDLIELR